MMTAQSRAATFASDAFILGVFLVNAPTLWQNSVDGSEAGSTYLLNAALAFLSIAVPIWVGTFIGVHLAPTSQRKVPAGYFLGVFYVVAGAWISMPIKTRAVEVDMSESQGVLEAVASWLAESKMAPLAVALCVAMFSALLAWVAVSCLSRVVTHDA